MSSSMPEIGSKISLISKADIRYEGKLFTVYPNESTIALSHVRSFGTEDRQAQYRVPAQSEVYECVLFRRTDIKDIRIINTQQLPDDPAIVMGMGPGEMSTGSGNYPGQPGFNHTMPSMPPQYSGYRAPGVGRTVGHQPLSSELPDSHLQHPPPHQPPPTHQPPPQVQVQGLVIPIVKEPNSELLSGSRSSTPSLSRKSPTNDQGVQVSPNKDKKPMQLPIPRDGNDRYQDSYQRRDYRGPRDNDYRDRNQRDGEYRDRNQRDGDFGDRGQNNALKEDHRMQRQGSHDRRDPDNRRESFPGQQKGGRGQQNRGGWVNRGGRGGGPGMRGRGRGGAPGNFNRAPGSGQAQQNKNNTGKQNTLKFEEEYDFDKAISEFEELKNKTAKLKISDGEVEKPKVNGEDKKDDSGNETGLGMGEPEEEPEQVPEQEVIYYDKAKSFFDNISCEAVERSKGRSQRTDWRKECKLNSETFGVALARRGGYRGRGGYYGGRGDYRVYNNRGYNNQREGRNPMNNTGQPRPLHQPPQDGEVEKPKVNGEDKKDDSGNETGLGMGEPEEEPEQVPEQEVIYYDKAKSFFDNISCEAVERSKGRSQRTDWRKECKLNSETFGVALARRGGYRGRGGYYGGRGDYRVYNNRGYNNQREGRNPMNNTGQPRPLHQPPQDGEVEKPKVNGEDKKDDSGNETGLGMGEPEEEPEQVPEQEVIYYDKAKSFFDNISCEAVERSKGQSQRTDWRKECKLNSETFGVALARRGGYRGRGGYYGGRGDYRVYNNRGYNNQREGRNPMNNTGQPRPLHQPPQAKLT